MDVPKSKTLLDYGHVDPPPFTTAPWAFLLAVALFASWVALELARVRLPPFLSALAFLGGFVIAIAFAALDLRRPQGRHWFSAFAILISFLGLGSTLWALMCHTLFS